MSELNTFGITKLKAIARKEGVIGYGQYRSRDKDELVKLILRIRRVRQQDRNKNQREESRFLRLHDYLHVMSVSDVFGINNTPKIPTKQGATLTLRIGPHGYKLLPSTAAGVPVQILNNRDDTGLEGTYYGGDSVITNIDMVRILKSLDNNGIVVKNPALVEVKSYNNLPLIFYTYRKPNPESLRLTQEVVFKTPGYKMWAVSDRSGYLGILVQSPFLHNMMGDQAGIMVYEKNGEATGFGNFDPNAVEEGANAKSRVFEPQNYNFMKPSFAVARKLVF